MATTYDEYGRGGTQDQGAPTPPGAPAAGAGNAQPLYLYRVTQAAGAGTAADILINVGAKSRVVDAWVLTTTGVTSAVVQLFTAASGGGTACSSAMTTAAAGVTRNALTTASQVIAAGGTLYAHTSGGATLAACEVFVLMATEQ